ncbi:histidine kinase [Burkholderiaceae bacterium UC74_6]
MSSVPYDVAHENSGPKTGGVSHVLRSWRSLRSVEFASFASAGLLFGLIDLSSLLEVQVGDHLPLVMLRHLGIPVIGCLILLLFWLPADRSEPLHPRRIRRLALAALLGSLVSILIITGLVQVLPWPSIMELMRAKKGLPPLPGMTWNGFIGDTLWILMPSGMMVAVIELLRRRQRSEATLARLVDEHSQLRRRAMAARLATLQAQVEPQLLFDALVDIEQAYGRSDGEAAARMDRLIQHLRVALPRLRETGSTLEAEAELLETYLGVLHGLDRTPLKLVKHWPAELRNASVPPMLLLPLLQRALRSGASAMPQTCTLTAESRFRGEGGLIITLAFDRPLLCGDAAELAALDERLQVFSDSARLRCYDDATHTHFTIELLA